MDETDACIGLCFTDHQLFYAVNNPGTEKSLSHIGSVDFNFNIRSAITGNFVEAIAGIQTVLSDLKKKHSCDIARILIPALFECWTTLPRIAYEQPDEREPHLHILMNGISRKNLQTTWFSLANQDYKFLLVRRDNIMKRISGMISDFPSIEYLSEFEIGLEWQLLTEINGSFMTVHCHQNYIAVASYLFGKLRGSTYFTYDSLSDIPFHWKYHSGFIKWMDGIHDHVYLFGSLAQELLEIKSSIWYEADDVQLMNTLSKMNVDAEEKTYGFDLEKAFPAIMLSLNLDSKNIA
ncbi:MAG: hypothetical protein ACFCU6_08560 [Balneolaceae bacterium]